MKDESKFKQLFKELSKKKQSLLIAGLDPTSAMVEGYGGSKMDFASDYIQSVSDHCMGIKINLAFWQDDSDNKNLKNIISECKKLNLLCILDSKIADIGSTNKVWLESQKNLGADASTLSPYAGNIEEIITQANELGLGSIVMGLMSNPEFKNEMCFKNTNGDFLWKHRVSMALKSGADAFVLGGTYNPSDPNFQEFLKITTVDDSDKNPVYLVPGIGTQGGKISAFASSGVDLTRCMINVGRGLMQPEDGVNKNTWKNKSKQLQDEINSFL